MRTLALAAQKALQRARLLENLLRLGSGGGFAFRSGGGLFLRVFPGFEPSVRFVRHMFCHTCIAPPVEAGNERIAQIIGADRKIRHTYAGLDLRRAGNQVGTDRNSAGKGL